MVVPSSSSSSSSSSTSGYRPAPLATLPPQLDPAEYNESPEKRRAQAERLALRASLKLQYQLQLNNPRGPGMIEDPAMLRWSYARTLNIYPNFRPTPKNSLLGLVFAIGPPLFWFFIIKAERDRRERLIQEGKFDRGFRALI